jgi:competence protein ComFB
VELNTLSMIKQRWEKMITNYMELVVDRLLVKVLEGYENICKCEICKDDIKARTLNQFKPLYYADDKGSAYSKLNELTVQFKPEVIKEIVMSVEIVSKNPRHTIQIRK